MRPARSIAIATVVAAALAVAGCTGRSTADRSTSDRPAAAPPASTAAPAATATTVVAAAPTSREPAVLADGRHPVLIKSIDAGGRRVTFDLIQFYQGEQAAIEAAKDHQESPPPNDLYIRNVNPRLRTLPVRAGAPITVNGLLATQTNTPVTLVKLAGLTRSSSPVFWVTVRDDQVLKIAEQWMP